MSFGCSAEIYRQGEPTDYLYKVVSGTVWTYKVLADGRRQVGGFYLPGDIFGLEADDAHTFSAKAITASNVLVIRRSAVVALAGKDVTRRLWTLTNNELHDQERPGKGLCHRAFVVVPDGAAQSRRAQPAQFLGARLK
jgi:CRP-like cAMP-binding protein